MPEMPEMPGGAPPPPPRLSWGSRLSLILGLLAGPAYVAWIAGVEGRQIFVVLGLVVMVAGCAALAHWLMAMTRR
jgi:hypothetical protein